ncbi:hypothetical protein [Leisingera methylohalidivorans]|uniref:hypothetical protein n=1 Tax=Leisingera methylohalidivorans TaxID=133924 RepID=UPI0012EB1145|nr:hypothetical protein [Leisingera methylohalidivorans]
MPELRRIPRRQSSRRQHHSAHCRPADAEAQDAYRSRPVFSRAQRASAAFWAILLFAAFFVSNLNLHHAEFAADLDPVAAACGLRRTGDSNLQRQHEDGAPPCQPPEEPGAASGEYERGARHLVQESLAAFAADTRGNFSAAI